MAQFDSSRIRSYYDRQTAGFLALGQGGGEGAIHRAVWGPGVTTRAQAFHFVEAQIAARLTAPGGTEVPPLQPHGRPPSPERRDVSPAVPLRGQRDPAVPSLHDPGSTVSGGTEVPPLQPHGRPSSPERRDVSPAVPLRGQLDPAVPSLHDPGSTASGGTEVPPLRAHGRPPSPERRDVSPAVPLCGQRDPAVPSLHDPGSTVSGGTEVPPLQAHGRPPSPERRDVSPAVPLRGQRDPAVPSLHDPGSTASGGTDVPPLQPQGRPPSPERRDVSPAVPLRGQRDPAVPSLHDPGSTASGGTEVPPLRAHGRPSSPERRDFSPAVPLRGQLDPAVPSLHDPGSTAAHVVDLGCGVAGSLTWLAARAPIRGTGITLSPVQARLAAERIRGLGLDGRVSCIEGDFTRLPDGVAEADLAFAIESFVHGPSPDSFFQSCARLVVPGGWLAICDDVLRAVPDAHAARTVSRFKAGWHINALVTREQLTAHARAAGFAHVETMDLTPWLELGRPRDRAIAAFVAAFGWLPLERTRIGHLVGGSALQTCLARGWVGYELSWFRREK